MPKRTLKFWIQTKYPGRPDVSFVIPLLSPGIKTYQKGSKRYKFAFHRIIMQLVKEDLDRSADINFQDI